MPIIDVPEGTDEIKVKKEINDLLRKIQEEAKPESCIVCGKKQTSFCNSHSVPKMVIKNIAENGNLYHANKLIDIPIVDNEKGVNNSGTFHFICRECDSSLFQAYENIDALQAEPDDKMLAEIALKDVLLMLSKRNQEQLIYQMGKKKGSLLNVESMEDIQFPLDGFSIVYAFYHRRDKLYRRLQHQMNCLSLEKKLEYINYWIFKYTENYYLSPKIQSVIDADNKLQELSRDNNDNPNLGYINAMDLLFPHEEIHSDDISNLLLKKYAI